MPHPGLLLELVALFCFWSSLFGTSFCFECQFVETHTKFFKYFQIKPILHFKSIEFKIVWKIVVKKKSFRIDLVHLFLIIDDEVTIFTCLIGYIMSILEQQ